MRKQIIAMLLAVAMCTELLAGCATSMVAETSTKTKIAQADKALLSKEAEEDSESVTSANAGQGEENTMAVIQTGSNGMVCGQVVNRLSGKGVEAAQITIYDSNGEQVAVTPYKRDVSTVLKSEKDYDLYEDLSLDGNATTIYVTDTFGYYFFQLPKPGTYTMQAEAEDYCEMTPQMITYYDKFAMTLEDVKKAFQEGVEKGFENEARLDALRGYRKELTSLADKAGLETALREAGVEEAELPTHIAQMEPSYQKAEKVMEKLNLMTGIDEGETEGAAADENKKKRTWTAFWEKIEKKIDKETFVHYHPQSGAWVTGAAPITYNSEILQYFLGIYRDEAENYPETADRVWNEEGGKEIAKKAGMEIAKWYAEEQLLRTA